MSMAGPGNWGLPRALWLAICLTWWRGSCRSCSTPRYRRPSRRCLRDPPMSEGISRPTWAQIDLDAVRHNVNVLKRLVHPAQLCAVVKADAYGHGALSVAAAAVKGGADCLAVAIVEEGIELREAGVTVPILLLSEPPPEASRALVAAGLTATGCTVATVETLDQAATELGL